MKRFLEWVPAFGVWVSCLALVVSVASFIVSSCQSSRANTTADKSNDLVATQNAQIQAQNTEIAKANSTAAFAIDVSETANAIAKKQANPRLTIRAVEADESNPEFQDGILTCRGFIVIANTGGVSVSIEDYDTLIDYSQWSYENELLQRVETFGGGTTGHTEHVYNYAGAFRPFYAESIESQLRMRNSETGSSVSAWPITIPGNTSMTLMLEVFFEVGDNEQRFHNPTVDQVRNVTKGSFAQFKPVLVSLETIQGDDTRLSTDKFFPCAYINQAWMPGSR